MIVDIVDKYRTDDNNPIKNLRLTFTRAILLHPRGGNMEDQRHILRGRRGTTACPVCPCPSCWAMRTKEAK